MHEGLGGVEQRFGRAAGAQAWPAAQRADLVRSHHQQKVKLHRGGPGNISI